MSHLLLCVMVIICGISPVDGNDAISAKDIWTRDGTYVTPWEKMSAEQKSFALEKYRVELDYCINNFGKAFKDLATAIINSSDYEKEVGYITYGLIGAKYTQYRDYQKAAEYYYKDYQRGKECQRDSPKTGIWFTADCWPGMVGEGSILLHITNILEMNNDYKAALPYYQKYLDDWVSGMEGKTYKEKYVMLKEKAKGSVDIGKEYNDFMERWKKAKRLAKTVKPTPLDPAVQNHEWFYSDKQTEVLKALNYYYKNKVWFMLAKALTHKDPVVAKKAKEYLEKLTAETKQ